MTKDPCPYCGSMHCKIKLSDFSKHSKEKEVKFVLSPDTRDFLNHYFSKRNKVKLPSEL